MKVPAKLAGGDGWEGLQTSGMVVSLTEREGKSTDETRCCLGSLAMGIKRLAEAVRMHWSNENQLHWILDVTFGQDQCRVGQDHGATNLALFRRMAISLFMRYKGDRDSVRQRRLAAGWNTDYLFPVFQQNNASQGRSPWLPTPSQHAVQPPILP